MHQKLYGFYLGGQFEVIKFALLICLHITLLYWSHTSLTLKKITETTALSPDKELQASTDKNSNLQGSGGVKQVLLLVEPWDLSMFELYREEYSTSERKITTWEPLCMNLERNIVSRGGGILNNLTSQDHLNLFEPKREAQHLRGDDPVYFTSQNNFTSQNHLTSQKHLMISLM